MDRVPATNKKSEKVRNLTDTLLLAHACDIELAALRFARVKRYRTDKTVVQADTIQTMTALFKTRRQ
ncbi:MAG: hypothetical protein LV473_07905 [Nitrospira sp.]|nr:hypothetical protein [Nitrospira sp.]